MALVSIISVETIPERQQDYRESVVAIAARARELNDEFRWTAHEVAYGGNTAIHFASSTENFADLGERGLAPEMVARVLGENEGVEMLRRLGSCTQSLTSQVSVDRPDLSYPPEGGDAISPFAVVTTLKARSGQQEACEELLRKIAEAIPKAGDPALMTTFQTIVGEGSQYWTSRPLRDLGELDQQLTPPDLLTKAFGAAEGGIIFRSGVGAIEQVERSIVIYREELSNPV